MRNRIIELIRATSEADPSIVFLTGDLGYSVVEPLEAALGERFINMGVAEANMISVASAMAATGLAPFAYSIAPFISARCFEQIRNDVAYHGRCVRLISVGSGFSYGSLGPSHHALEDASLLAQLPGMIVANPCNTAELDRLYMLVMLERSPAYLRIARENGPRFDVGMTSLHSGAYEVKSGRDITLVASGVTVTESLAASELLARDGIAAAVVSVPVLAPFPRQALLNAIKTTAVISVFEGYPGNPLTVGTMSALLDERHGIAFASLDAPMAFPSTVGNTAFLRKAAGLDAQSIANRAVQLLARTIDQKVGAA
jgi:transketolase